MRRGGEVWKHVPGLPRRIEVSNTGLIRTSPYKDKRGWRRKAQILKGDEFYFNDKWYCRAGMILLAFVGPAPKGRKLARHLDDNRRNNAVENLAWGNDQDNHDDAIRNGINYASYGRLGKACSDETRAKMSAAHKGRPTGRRISSKQKDAMLKGYRKKFPVKIKKSIPCCCGCGVQTKPGSRFIHGHAGRLILRKIAIERIGKIRPW